MYIFGASGHGKVVKSILEAMGITISGFIDDNPKSDELMGLPVMPASEIKSSKLNECIIAVGNNAIRKKIAERLSVSFKTAIHPSVVIDQSVFVGEGTAIMPNAVINADSKIGRHGIINSGAVVEHDCILEDYVHISPNATLTGGVTVGEGTQIGVGAVVLPGITIGKWAMVGAGAVVIRDVPDYAVVVGNPGKIIKYNGNE